MKYRQSSRCKSFDRLSKWRKHFHGVICEFSSFSRNRLPTRGQLSGSWLNINRNATQKDECKLIPTRTIRALNVMKFVYSFNVTLLSESSLTFRLSGNTKGSAERLKRRHPTLGTTRTYPVGCTRLTEREQRKREKPKYRKVLIDKAFHKSETYGLNKSRRTVRLVFVH